MNITQEQLDEVRKAYRQGNKEPWGKLLTEQQKFFDLTAYGNSSNKDPSYLQDVVGTVFLKLMKLKEIPENPAKLKNFIIKCIKNQLIDDIRKKGKFLSFDNDSAIAAVVHEYSAPDYHPSDQLIAEEERVELRNLIAKVGARVPAFQREAFEAHTLNGDSFEAIAECQGVGVSTAKTRVNNFRRKLLAEYEKQFEDKDSPEPRNGGRSFS